MDKVNHALNWVFFFHPSLCQNSILNLTDKMGNTMEFQNDSLSLTAPSLALSMIDVAPEGFNGLTFRAVSISSLQEPNVIPTMWYSLLKTSFSGIDVRF